MPRSLVALIGDGKIKMVINIKKFGKEFEILYAVKICYQVFVSLSFFFYIFTIIFNY